MLWRRAIGYYYLIRNKVINVDQVILDAVKCRHFAHLGKKLLRNLAAYKQRHASLHSFTSSGTKV